jgi:oligopeptide/dipeptide ABC transporter ATP-binding protein
MVPLLEIRDLRKDYVVRSRRAGGTARTIHAVAGVSFSVDAGETLGLVGESGCGKSTLARTLLFLEAPTAGDIVFEGQRIGEREAVRLRRRAQIVFQDPYASLPPRMRIGRIIAEPLLIHRIVRRADVEDRVAGLLRDVGLKPSLARALPHELSGGQRQRVGIARALAVQPSLLIADEAVSSLDVSVQAQILNLLRDLQERHGLAYLFISHDLGVVTYMSHRVAVMYLGKIVELVATADLRRRALHPYTRSLLSAVPTLRGPNGGRVRLAGEPPDPAMPPAGCAFHPRCPIARPVCGERTPGLDEWLPGRRAACHFALVEDDGTTSDTVGGRAGQRVTVRGGEATLETGGLDA